ncbi:MAG: thymidine phosphorylase [Planctomycetota bacterium]
MDIRPLVKAKRGGGELSTAEIRSFVAGAADGSIGDAPVVELLAAIHRDGMGERELADLTRAMIDSGRTLSFEELPQPKADKHSTGGIGDKVSIPLAPAVAACGVCVPMISGRGLGHTGGTLDKLESIPGFRTNLSEEEIHRAIDGTGVAFAAQSRDLVPADRRLYALRHASDLVDSIPLIASSIMSKKLAEGISALVLDVKFGSGAFLPEPGRGAELGRAMLGLAAAHGVRATAFQTAMDRPLGCAVGHALEIADSIDCLAGEGPADLRELVVLFGGEMLVLAGAATSTEEGRRKIAGAIDSGRALGVFELVVREQGGDPRIIQDRSRLPGADSVEPFLAPRDGFLVFTDCRKVGMAVAALGGSRKQPGEPIDHAVGLVWRIAAGEPVRAGQAVAEIHHRGGRGLARAKVLLEECVRVEGSATTGPLVLGRV